MAGQLMQVKDPGPALQAEADKRLPLGWCNVCVGKAKQAMVDGGAPGPVRAAVTMVPRVQFMDIPGLGQSPAVITIPVCWDDIGATKASSLLQAQGSIG